MTPTFNCLHCGKLFDRPRTGRPKVYCSSVCLKRAARVTAKAIRTAQGLGSFFQ